MVTTSKTGAYTVIEQVTAPYLIEPQSLFGMNTVYTSSYISHKGAHTVNISKTFVLNDLFRYDIFRLNYMNIISNRAQNAYSRLWEESAPDFKSKLIRFFLQHCERPQGEKVFKIKMENLARCVDATRLNTSKALNELQDEGLVKLKRKEVIIPQAEKLKEYATSLLQTFSRNRE